MPAEGRAAGLVAPEAAEWVDTLIHTRHTVMPRRLGEPGPDAAQAVQILSAAAAAPDHGQLMPWRFVVVPAAARAALGQAFADALLERDPQATAVQQDDARAKAFRAPWLLLAVARTEGGDPAIDRTERLLSAGCALQNMLLTAHALGFGAALTSGKALKSAALRMLFDLGPGELALCFLSVGTPLSRRPGHGAAGGGRNRPELAAYVSSLVPPPG